MLRTRATQAQAQASTSSSSPGSGSGTQSTPKQHLGAQVHDYTEPDTPIAHYDNRTHAHARNESAIDTEIDPLDKEAKSIQSHARTTSREMNGQQGGGLAGRRGEKSLFLDGLSRLQALGSGGKGKGKAQYRLGLSHRAWLLITVVIGLIMISKLLFPSSQAHTHSLVDTASLIPRNYINASQTDPAPFEFCPVFGPSDAIAARRGQTELLRSRLHTGTGARVQRVLNRAMSGAPITISVLGGSISACTGAGDDPVGHSCYPHKFFDWWNTVFPHPANELTNGAVKKTDSAYYAYCSSHHMPDKADLVILEFDAADPNDPEWLQHFELLVRSVLVRPEMPAVIILGHFSPQIQAVHGFAGPELLHNVVAQFYDVPHISVKGVIYEDYLAQPEQARSRFYSDPNHANAEGHDLITDVLISYIMSQICSGWSTIQGHSFETPLFGLDESAAGGPSLLGGVGLRKGMPGQQPGDGESVDDNGLSSKFSALKVPQGRMADRPADAQRFREIEPFCVAASDLINPLPPSLFYGSGWKEYHPPKNALIEDRHYWYAEQPTARLRVPLKLGAGDVGIYFLQSPPDKPLGSVKCWVDDNYAGGTVLSGTAEVEDVIATLVMIDRGVSRGSHFVECQLQGEAGAPSPPFKILGIFTT